MNKGKFIPFVVAQKRSKPATPRRIQLPNGEWVTPQEYLQQRR